jgi:hypothetical protein
MAERSNRFMQLFRQTGAQLARASRQAGEYFARLIDRLAGRDDSSERRIFQRAYREKGAGLESLGVSWNPSRADDARKVNRLTREHLGRLFIFFYNPKWKDDDNVLPYYDRVPLIMLLDIRKNGRILGLNFHYLPPRHRAILMDAINDNEIRNRYRQDRRLRMSYQILQRAVRGNPLYRNCIKEYIVSEGNYLRSPFVQIPSEDWDVVLFMPFERFVKKDRHYVWRESLRKARA